MSEQPPQTETTEMDTIPPGALAHVDVEAHAVLQVTKLAEFLVENFPDEIALTNRQQPETPADTAIRLLLALSATAPATTLRHCSEPYCNRPEGHAGEHGMVHAG